MDVEDEYTTYKLARECANCHKPIPDQEHGLRRFCPDIEFTDGSRESCKDRYNTRLKKERYAAVQALFTYYKGVLDSIIGLLTNYGEVVSLEQINEAGINLKMALVLVKEGDFFTFCFPGYQLKMIANNQFKIICHELIYQ